MSEETNPAGGAGEGNGSADPKTQELKTDESPKMVSFENHRRALDDMHKYKSKAKELEEQALKAKEQRLAETEDHKAEAKHYKEQAEKYKATADKVTDGFINTQKQTVVVEAALAQGLLPEAVETLKMYSFEGVEIQTVESASGKTFRVEGAKDFVERLKVRSPFLFRKEGAPQINSGGAGSAPLDPKSLTAADVWTSEKQWKTGQISQADFLAVNERYAKQKLK